MKSAVVEYIESILRNNGLRYVNDGAGVISTVCYAMLPTCQLEYVGPIRMGVTEGDNIVNVFVWGNHDNKDIEFVQGTLCGGIAQTMRAASVGTDYPRPTIARSSKGDYYIVAGRYCVSYDDFAEYGINKIAECKNHFTLDVSDPDFEKEMVMYIDSYIPSHNRSPVPHKLLVSRFYNTERFGFYVNDCLRLTKIKRIRRLFRNCLNSDFYWKHAIVRHTKDSSVEEIAETVQILKAFPKETIRKETALILDQRKWQ